jgi:hypothetical protein
MELLATFPGPPSEPAALTLGASPKTPEAATACVGGTIGGNGLGGGAPPASGGVGGPDEAASPASRIALAAGNVRLLASRVQPGPAPAVLSHRITVFCAPFRMTHHTRGRLALLKPSRI